MFPCTVRVDLSPCCFDIQAIVSTHVECVLCMTREPTTLPEDNMPNRQKSSLLSQLYEIPYFKPISVLFYLFRDRRHTVSTWVETMV